MFFMGCKLNFFYKIFVYTSSFCKVRTRLQSTWCVVHMLENTDEKQVFQKDR